MLEGMSIIVLSSMASIGMPAAIVPTSGTAEGDNSGLAVSVSSSPPDSSRLMKPLSTNRSR